MPAPIPSRMNGRQSDEVAQQTRQRIILSARAVFAARGFDGVSLRDIAAHAGVTHGLLRHHFGSKEDIWRAVIDAAVADYFADLAPLLATAAQQGSTPVATLAAATRLLVRSMARHPDVTRLLMHEGIAGGPRLDYFMQQIAPIRAVMDPLAQAARREGYLQQFDHQTGLLALLMLGAMPFALSAFTAALCDLDIFAPDQVELHAERVVATLLPQPRAAAPGDGATVNLPAEVAPSDFE